MLLRTKSATMSKNAVAAVSSCTACSCAYPSPTKVPDMAVPNLRIIGLANSESRNLYNFHPSTYGFLFNTLSPIIRRIIYSMLNSRIILHVVFEKTCFFFYRSFSVCIHTTSRKARLFFFFSILTRCFFSSLPLKLFFSLAARALHDRLLAPRNEPFRTAATAPRWLWPWATLTTQNFGI